ncbi:MAG: hypothetical protein WCS42_15720 [Verrucomicrobiota bacterium]
MHKKTKFRLVSGVILLGIIALACVVFARYPNQARRAWKEAALQEISHLADDSSWVSEEINMLNVTNSSTEHIIAERWLTDHMILMLGGEWLVYKSHCSKESPHLVHDIFLAKGSNGKWFYSTCHFCVGMCALVMMQDEPPVDLATFARRYHLKEFDGVSDTCLQPTQTFPDSNDMPVRTYTAAIKPGLPDLAPLLRAATKAGIVATNLDPDLKEHVLDLHSIRFSHRFLQSNAPAVVAYTGIYCDSKLSGGNATGIGIEVRDLVAQFKSQKGQPLVAYPLDGEPRVPEDALAMIAVRAITNFWPQIETKRLSLDEIVCCDPLNGDKYSVNLRLCSPFVGKTSPMTYTMIEVNVSTNGTVEEKDVRWTSR